MDLAEREKQLREKNLELERRKKELDAELAGLDSSEDPAFCAVIEPSAEAVAVGEPGEEEPSGEEEQKQEDIIGMLEAVKKAAQERAVSKLRELRKQHDDNKVALLRNGEKIQTLESNVEQAEAAVRIKTELKAELESKGKRVSEESKKWITEVTKQHDKAEELKALLASHLKDEENIKAQHATTEHRITDLIREKNSYESQHKHLTAKIQQLKLEVENAKQTLRERDHAQREETQKKQKTQEKGQQHIKRLERQRNELLKAYKKLGQYIALLRKTNTHLQTASSLGFTLKEYLQAVDKPELIIE